MTCMLHGPERYHLHHSHLHQRYHLHHLQKVGFISSKTLAYDCLHTLYRCCCSISIVHLLHANTRIQVNLYRRSLKRIYSIYTAIIIFSLYYCASYEYHMNIIFNVIILYWNALWHFFIGICFVLATVYSKPPCIPLHHCSGSLEPSHRILHYTTATAP